MHCIVRKGLGFRLRSNESNKTLYYKELSPAEEWVSIDYNLAHGYYALEDVIFEYWCIGEYNEEKEKAFNVENALEKLGFKNLKMSRKDRAGMVMHLKEILEK